MFRIESIFKEWPMGIALAFKRVGLTYRKPFAPTGFWGLYLRSRVHRWDGFSHSYSQYSDGNHIQLDFGDHHRIYTGLWSNQACGGCAAPGPKITIANLISTHTCGVL
jgi:hypothetical protein